jgi:hypothetical protein
MSEITIETEALAGPGLCSVEKDAWKPGTRIVTALIER